MDITINVTAPWAIVINSMVAGKNPHHIETFNCDKSIIEDDICDHTKPSFLQGCWHWAHLGNTLEVFHNGEKIQEITKEDIPIVPQAQDITWYVSGEYMDEDTCNWEWDFVNFDTQEEAHAFMDSCETMCHMSVTAHYPHGIEMPG